jgi:cysteinyl-tRNA synthetase
VPPEIEALALQRLAARKAKQWADSDRLRALIQAQGWDIEDGAAGYTLKRRG